MLPFDLPEPQLQGPRLVPACRPVGRRTAASPGPPRFRPSAAAGAGRPAAGDRPLPRVARPAGAARRQDWRDGIHQALRGCAGAVILLSPEALESRWVLKETTILAWRAFLGEPVLMIPVLLGIDETDLVTHGFEPSGVTAIQAEVVPDERRAPVDEIAERIVARFDEIVPTTATGRASTWASTVERWLEETARLLHEDDERYLRDMFAVLGLDVDDEDVDRFDADRFRTVAAELLVAGPDEILDVLHTVSGVRTADQKAMLRRAVEALWVDARAANRLPYVASRAEPPRVVAIDADEPVTGRHYVERAYCGKLRFDRIFTPDDHTDGSREHALARVEDMLADLPADRGPGAARRRRGQERPGLRRAGAGRLPGRCGRRAGAAPPRADRRRAHRTRPRDERAAAADRQPARTLVGGARGGGPPLPQPACGVRMTTSHDSTPLEFTPASRCPSRTSGATAARRSTSPTAATAPPTTCPRRCTWPSRWPW